MRHSLVSTSPALPNGIARIVFKEIPAGDRRKFVARSNDADTGGGARDLRFRNWDNWNDVLICLFPTPVPVLRRRGNTQVQVTVYQGCFHWVDPNGIPCSKEVLLEPPTDARPNEGRIAQVHKYGCFQVLPPTEGTGRLLLLLVQKDDETVWPVFATEYSLEHDNWHPQVASFLLEALRAVRPANITPYGYVDFVTEQKYYNGR